MADFQTVPYKKFAEIMRARAIELADSMGCTITKIQGGYLVKGPNANLKISDLKYLYRSDLN
jgi:hypothetical protein